jgi:hypothetical protein
MNISAMALSFYCKAVVGTLIQVKCSQCCDGVRRNAKAAFCDGFFGAAKLHWTDIVSSGELRLPRPDDCG